MEDLSQKSSVVFVWYLEHVFFSGSLFPIESVASLDKRSWQLHKVERYLLSVNIKVLSFAGHNYIYCRSQQQYNSSCQQYYAWK